MFLALFLGVGAGAWLDSAFDAPLIMPAAMVVTGLGIGLALLIIRRRGLARVACPECGAKNLEPFSDGDGQWLLTCHRCGIQWETGLFERDTDSNYTEW